MKLIPVIIVLLSLSTAAFSMGESPPDSNLTQEQALVFDADITVVAKGIVCPFCAQGLKKAFKENGSVALIRFDEDINSFDLKLNDNTELSDDTIKQLIKEAGFLTESIKRH